MKFNPSQKSPAVCPRKWISPWDECYIAFSAQEEAPDFSPGSFTRTAIILSIFIQLALACVLNAEEAAESQRLKNELAMEKEASKMLGQKLLKSYEEKVILENQISEANERIKELETELAKTRTMMENEVAKYRKKIGSLQVEIGELNKKNKVFKDKSKISEYIHMLEEEKKRLTEELAKKEGMLDVLKKEQGDIDGESK